MPPPGPQRGLRTYPCLRSAMPAHGREHDQRTSRDDANASAVLRWRRAPRQLAVRVGAEQAQPAVGAGMPQHTLRPSRHPPRTIPASTNRERHEGPRSHPCTTHGQARLQADQHPTSVTTRRPHQVTGTARPQGEVRCVTGTRRVRRRRSQRRAGRALRRRASAFRNCVARRGRVRRRCRGGRASRGPPSRQLCAPTTGLSLRSGFKRCTVRMSYSLVNSTSGVPSARSSTSLRRLSARARCRSSSRSRTTL